MKSTDIIKKVNDFFTVLNGTVSKAIPVPAILLLCAAVKRPGMSSIKSLTNICQKFEALGIPTSVNPDGSPNLVVQATFAIVQEMNRSITEDAIVQGGIESGNVTITSSGANAAGPVVSVGSNLLPIKTWGIIQ